MTFKYKLYKSDEKNYIIQMGRMSIPVDSMNRHYQQFVDDIYEQGIGIVEGADIQTEIPYAVARVAEYPPIKDQLDKIYHGGIDAWKADIKVIKDKYPKTQVGITSIEPIPEWVKTALFDKQKEKYIQAKARLEQYELSAGVKEEGNPWNGKYIVEPLPLYVYNVDVKGRNPLVVQDETERAAAREVINNTPQAVIESVSS